MGKKIWLTMGFALLFLCTTAASQSLVELAKKEKERRAKLKGHKSIVLTNKDLKKVSIKSAVIARPNPDAENQKPPSEDKSIPSPAQSESSIKVTVADKSSESQKSAQATDEEKLKEAEEAVGRLTMKMRALWREFYSMDDMTSRDSLQQQISQTFQLLQQAQEKVAELRKKLGLPPPEDPENSIIIR